jgi:hypothetical protein
MSEPSNGKGDKPRNCFSQQFRENYDQIFRKEKPMNFNQEYRIVDDDHGHFYIIKVDECAIFDKWVSATEGRGHYPAFFEPKEITIKDLRFTNWRVEA